VWLAASNPPGSVHHILGPGVQKVKLIINFLNVGLQVSDPRGNVAGADRASAR
jgi:hypothetical protein